MAAIITLTTDFGLGSPYVAAMKGVILSLNPVVRLLDVSHSIEPQNVRQASLLLAGATPWFPARTIHVAVVDPGVGTARKVVYAEIGDQRYVCPDNGLLSRLTLKEQPGRLVAIENAEFWLPSVSATFHGRDIMAPVAAQLSLGLEPERLGPPLPELVPLDWPEPLVGQGEIRASVLWIDGFGNLITNISANLVASLGDPHVATVEILGYKMAGIARTYGEQPSGALIALVGSSGQLEIAIVNGSAAERLAANVGVAVVIRQRREPQISTDEH